LPPPLYQSNPFARQTEPTEISEIRYQLSVKEVLATAQEIQDIEKGADEEALSQAIEQLIETTRAGRRRTATSKVVENEEQARQDKVRKTRDSRGGCRGGRGGGRCSGQKV
jgi:hypothetical protein